MRWSRAVGVWLFLATAIVAPSIAFPVALAILGGGCGGDAAAEAPAATAPRRGDPTGPPERDGPAIVVAAGDIACVGCAQRETADLIEKLNAERTLSAILVLGDAAYPTGALEEYRAYYAPAWGRPPLLDITRPALGGHDYLAPPGDGSGYFDFFYGAGVAGGPFGARGEGYYSYDLHDWHLVALNTGIGCAPVACGEGSAQLAWLEADLAAHPGRCTLAYFHDPRFQSGVERGDADSAAPLWNALYRAGADVVLSAHDHNYQQLAPLDELGRIDPVRGLRSFVVGTGGAPLYPDLGDRHREAIEARQAERHGVLELTLHPTRFEWRFVAVGGDVLASGEADCH